jgi:hypothetical protein
MSKKIIEAQSRSISDADREHFAKYEAMFESGAKERVVQGVDMTPQAFTWQEVDRVDLGDFCGKDLNELHDVVDTLINKHGTDARLCTYSYSSGGGWSMRADVSIPATEYTGLKVVKYRPQLTQEQYIAQRNQGFIDLGEKFKAQQIKAKDKQAKQLKKLVKRLREADEKKNGKN